MNKIEKSILLMALLFQLVITAMGIRSMTIESAAFSQSSPLLLMTAMIFSVAAIVVIFRDLYKREFPNPNSKITWLLLMMFTGGIGIVVYALWHGLRPRKSI